MVGGHRAVGLGHVNMPIGYRRRAVGEFDQGPLAELRQNDRFAKLFDVIVPARGLPALRGTAPSSASRYAAKAVSNFVGVALTRLNVTARDPCPRRLTPLCEPSRHPSAAMCPAPGTSSNVSPLMRRRWKKSHVERMYARPGCASRERRYLGRFRVCRTPAKLRCVIR